MISISFLPTQELLQTVFATAAHEYALEAVGNFVLQAALRRLAAELERRDRRTAELTAMEHVARSLLSQLSNEKVRKS